MQTWWWNLGLHFDRFDRIKHSTFTFNMDRCCQLATCKINGVSRFHSNGSRKIKICWFKNLQVQIFLNWVMVSWVYFAYIIEILRFSVRFFLLLLSIFTSVFDVCQWHNVTINCFPENHATLHSITNPTKRTKSSKYENCVKYQIESCSIYFTISQRHRFSDLANLEQIPLISVRGCSINHEMNHLSSVSHAIDCSIIRLIVITWLIQ